MRVLVTGSNGLLGHHLIFQLLERGYDVSIIVRNLENVYFDISGMKVYEGNFYDVDILQKALNDCDTVIHLAAVTGTNLRCYEEYSRINVDAAKTVANIALGCGIKKIVFISTSNTIGYGDPCLLSNESFPFQFPFTESFYAISKKEAEMYFDFLSREKDNQMIIIHPSFLIGAYDTKPSSGELLLYGYKKLLLFVPKGGKNFVSAKDVAKIIVESLEKGKNGEHYLITGINCSFKDFYRLQSRLMQYPQVVITLPNWMLLIAGKFGDLVRKFGVRTSLCTQNVRQLIVQEYYSNTKATEEFKMTPTDLGQSILEALIWFKKAGKIH